PADVMKHALDSAHGNYPLAMLTAHNYLKEIAYVGREEMDSIGKAVKPADKAKWPAQWYGVSPWLGDAARKLRGLRDSRVPDKMGPWYHFFVSFAAEAWGSVEAAEEMTAWEHFFRRWKVFTPDPEKCEVDLIAIHTMKEIRGEASRAGAGDPEGLQNLSTAPPPAVLGKLRVEATDPLFPDGPANYMSFRAETGSATGRYVFTFLGGREVEVPAGKYTISLYDSPWHTAGEREAVVEPGRTTQVDMVLVFVNGFLDVSVTDGKTGQELTGLDVAVSGPVSDGPFPAPVSLDFTPGSYRVIVPKSTVNGKLYREREMTAEVVAGRRTRVTMALTPYEGPPAAALIRITPGALELHPGDREELAAEVEDKDGAKIPGTSIVWTSSAPAVAGIDAAGEVTGVSAGKALITAASGGAKASIVVQVLSMIQLQSCRITNTPRSLPARGGTFLLKGAAYDTDGRPIEAGLRFSWASHNIEVATVDTETGRIMTQKPGSFTVSLVAAAGDGTEDSAMEDIVVESAWADVLVDGRVLKPDGSPAAGALVGAGGGPVVMSDGSGDYTVLAGGGPHKEGGTIPIQASLDGASGRASGRVQDGFVRGVTIVLEPAAPPASVAAAAGNKPKTLTAEERQARLDRIKEWQKALDCLLEGKRKSPDAWLDCNGNYTMR
ncbi:MAG: Ig-like domain-containing protein, partial [Candidatus Aminicenantales bacterium]